MSAPIFLLLDTTASSSSFALYQGGHILASREHNDAHQQAAIINDYINEILEEAKLSFQDLAAVGICSGPGSYTGLRIGYSVAKGICYGLEIPFIPVHKFDVVAQESTQYPLFIAIQARVGEYFVGIKGNNGDWHTGPEHKTQEEVLALLEQIPVQAGFIDSTSQDLEQLSTGKFNSFNPSDLLNMSTLGAIVQERFVAKEFTDIAYAEPLYLKSVYTTVSKKKSLFDLT